MKNMTCCNCGTKFGMEDSIYSLRKEDGEEFSCPNGHKQYFTESENSKLKKEVERLTKNRDYYKERFDRRGEGIDRLSRSLSATKGVVTKLKMKLYPERYEKCQPTQT